MQSRRNRECTRKWRHLDYLSAIKHAVRLAQDETLAIYPCSYCDGLHVGHHRSRRGLPPIDGCDVWLLPSDPLYKAIMRTRGKIARATLQQRQHPNTDTEKHRMLRQQLTSLQSNLEKLENQLEQRSQTMDEGYSANSLPLHDSTTTLHTL
jgi:hypothetical protein